MGITDWLFPKNRVRAEIEMKQPQRQELPQKKEETIEDIEEKKRLEERKKRTDLILEYEDLLKRRELLMSELNDDAVNLYKLANLVERACADNSFQKRHTGDTAEKVLASFDTNCIDDYWEIKRKAIECEKLFFQLFKLRQQLKLRGVDQSLREDD